MLCMTGVLGAASLVLPNVLVSIAHKGLLLVKRLRHLCIDIGFPEYNPV